MSLADDLMREFSVETATTRKLLERLPEDRFAFRPHPKSMTLGRLATHVAEIPSWSELIMRRSAFDLAELGDRRELSRRSAILALFEEKAALLSEVLKDATDEALRERWQLRRGEAIVFDQPRAAALRGMVFSHLIHHRGQLTVYLRMNEVALPGVYGPSADES